MSMKSHVVGKGLVGLTLGLLVTLGCAQSGTGASNGSGGSNSSSGGNNGSSGGSKGSGGSSSSSGGNPGAGGSSTSSGGNPGAGGSSTSSGGNPGSGGSSTSSGGNPGSGGSSTSSGGSPGSGGATVVQKVCATKTKIVTPVFMDFENYNGTSDPTMYSTAFGGTTVNTGTAYAGTYQYPEASSSPAATLTVGGGHPPSNWAGGENLAATMWGMGGGIWMGCADASAYKGISFWVRGSSGTGSMTFTISMESTTMPDASNSAGGGTCPGTSDTCKAAEKDGIPVTSDWTQVSLLWSDFTPGMSGTGTAVTPDGNNISGFGWTLPLQFQADPTKAADAGVYVPVPATMTLNIDDITFMQ
jgi:hypothetical protein